MIADMELTKWANRMRERVNLGARLVLWNGQQFDLVLALTPN